MLSASNYTQEYVNQCRSRIAEQVGAYRALIAAARDRPDGSSQLDAVISAFKPHFFNNLVLALDSSFVHRAKDLAKKDGNPLNEVRMICNSIMNNGGAMCADSTIKFDPARSVLKYGAGDRIELNEADFILLSSGFFAEIEDKYL